MAQLNKKIIIEGYIIALSGIMVGGTNSSLGIGGVDKQVIRNPISNLPYIPGSSLKGKMRSLFELINGTIGDDNGPTHNPKHKAARLFGHIKNSQNNHESQQASRIIIRDAELINPEDIEGTELPFTETKVENSIDRITSKANPRTFERVPKDARFQLNITLNVFEGDDDFLGNIFNALKLVEDDYIGGSGSRGNGQVKFVIEKMIERNKDYYLGKVEEDVDISDQIPESLRIVR